MLPLTCVRPEETSNFDVLPNELGGEMRNRDLMIFSDQFRATDPAKIADAIRTTGFFAMENAVTPAFLEQIEDDVAQHRFGFNCNEVTGVIAGRQYYLVDMLAISKAFFDYCTDSTVFAISRELLGPQYRLKALRYYETRGGYHMQWHTDNKTDKNFAHIPGIIFITYVSDVADGEFQYISGSNKWSGESGHNDYTDAVVAEKYSKDIVSFKMPRGSMVIYDTYGVHRAKPVMHDETFVRKSLFFQTDASLDDAIRIIVNTAYLDKADDETRMFLGFGMPGDYTTYPQTGLESLPLTRETGKPLVEWVAKNAKKKIKQLISQRAS
jgi:hypothetical protein